MFCCVVVCVSLLSLSPLSDRVLIVVVAAALVFRLHLEGGRHGDKDVDRGRVDAVVDDEGLLSKTDKHNELDYNCNQSNRSN